MIKKKYIKRLYIEEAYCDKCGSIMEPTGTVLTTFPLQYSYACSNKECDETVTFFEENKPHTLKFEYEEEQDVSSNCPYGRVWRG